MIPFPELLSERLFSLPRRSFWKHPHTQGFDLQRLIWNTLPSEPRHSFT